MLVKIIWIVAGALIAVGAMIWLGKAAEAKEESSKEESSDEKSPQA